MTLPPRWVRRLVLAPAVVALTFLVLVTLPAWLVLAAALSPLLPGRLRVLRVTWVVVVALVLESAVLGILLGLWVAAGFGLALRTPRFQYLHYRVVGWYLRVLYREAARVLRLRVEIEGPDPDEYLDRPLVVCCRHAGPGDSFLLVHALVNWYAREPRIVLAAALQWDPALDVLLNRLPNRFVSAGGGDRLEGRIGELATGLDHDDAFVIFPEGGNFTERRRLAGIARLRARGLEEMARRSEAMRHVLPPRPGGLTAALAAAPDADVVWVAHAGLDHLFTVAGIWRELPLDATVRMRWWRVPAADVPRTQEAQVDWLYGWWERIDDWVDRTR
ncbi:1-acyl-sn-glycerol-3-phosphate acyltransferase [Pseudonocardia broussonetiae]|uniref:1-acyl-sn-glycerol-3-phosphate acyltransferase n=1 Tax=Pseudonocardia broussonetiae TaxID=2736640 RepID=A0A6M6JKD8_9PSEU|nr:1-acyl-sn-glycerol-3-phosphate acyltransferase [Pseudonocardia broussonetiae]QJY47407.1 1-acyl-sn-glycerol-3-phosphate acyltransferase [Pseudonocardia broussonetiae]